MISISKIWGPHLKVSSVLSIAPPDMPNVDEKKSLRSYFKLTSYNNPLMRALDRVLSGIKIFKTQREAHFATLMERAKPSKLRTFEMDSIQVERMEAAMKEEFLYEKKYFATILQAAAIIYTRTFERATIQQSGLAKLLFKLIQEDDSKKEVDVS